MMITKIPGYTEKQILDIIERLVTIMTPRMTFGYYGLDDIKQESRIFALEALSRYEPGKPLERFLAVHIKNRLINLKRNKLLRKHPPCFTCPKYQPKKADTCSAHIDKDNCKLWTRWYNRNQAKTSLTAPMCLEPGVTPQQYIAVEEPPDIVIKKELMSLVDKYLPMELRRDYITFLEGGELSRWRENKVLAAIVIIMEKYYKNGDWD